MPAVPESPALPLQPRDYLILLALSGGRLHGYGVVKEVERISEGTVRMDPANLHRALKRMVRDGLVRDAGRHAAGDGRRRYFELADPGRRLAQAEAARLETVAAVARARLLRPGSEGTR